jgi:hypothetical protein
VLINFQDFQMNSNLPPHLLNSRRSNNSQVPPPPPNTPVSPPTHRSSTLDELPGIMAGIVDLERGRSSAEIAAEFAPPGAANDLTGRAQTVIAMVQAYQGGVLHNEETFLRFAHHIQTPRANLVAMMLPNGDLTASGQIIFRQHATDEQRVAFANRTNARTGLARDLDGIELQPLDQPFDPSRASG